MKRGLLYRSLLFQFFLLVLLFHFQDIGGQIIYVGPDETYTNIKWALGQAKDGIYFVVMKVGQQLFYRKILLVR